MYDGVNVCVRSAECCAWRRNEGKRDRQTGKRDRIGEMCVMAVLVVRVVGRHTAASGTALIKTQGPWRSRRLIGGARAANGLQLLGRRSRRQVETALKLDNLRHCRAARTPSCNYLFRVYVRYLHLLLHCKKAARRVLNYLIYI